MASNYHCCNPYLLYDNFIFTHNAISCHFWKLPSSYCTPAPWTHKKNFSLQEITNGSIQVRKGATWHDISLIGTWAIFNPLSAACCWWPLRLVCGSMLPSALPSSYSSGKNLIWIRIRINWRQLVSDSQSWSSPSGWIRIAIGCSISGDSRNVRTNLFYRLKCCLNYADLFFYFKNEIYYCRKWKNHLLILTADRF
jgi:hypothetical protein